jgi:UDP-glucose 4-epimerase
MILVTGGAGYIGSHAVKLLLERKEKVVVIDNLFRGYRQAIETLSQKYGSENIKFYQADLRKIDEIEQVIGENQITGVLHFGALCLVNESMEQPELYFENNVMGTLNLLRAMEKYQIRKIVFSSTCAIYGESQYLPVDEQHPTNPANPYGESKLMAEKIINWYGQLKGMKYVVFRYFNVAGAAESGLIGDSKKPSQLLMQNAVRGALGIETFRLTCPDVETSDRTPIRDYINVEDLVEAHLMALDYLERGGESEIFNLGTGQGNSVLEIVNKVKELTGADFEIQKAEPRKGEYAQIYANITKVEKILGWKPKRGVRESVESLVRWYKNRPKGWEY